MSIPAVDITDVAHDLGPIDAGSDDNSLRREAA